MARWSLVDAGKEREGNLRLEENVERGASKGGTKGAAAPEKG